MRTCIACETEFEDWVEVCPDCGAATADALGRERWEAARRVSAQEHFVVAHTLDGPVEKAILTAMLTDAGIPWVLHDHAADALQPLYAVGRGGGQILVPGSRLTEATALIGEFQRAAPVSE